MSGLYLYPFKSGGGIPVSSVRVGSAGLHGDREWMAVDARGEFVSLRTHPRMALMRVRLDPDFLELMAPEGESLVLPRAAALPSQHEAAGAGAVRPYQIWFSERLGVDCGDEAASWMSRFLGQPCRIVRARAPDDGEALNAEGRVRAGFADAAPALLIASASLDALNRRLPVPLTMARFRPNIVVDGLAAFAEDAWRGASIGSVDTRTAGPCPRCAATLLDPVTGEKGVEPLRTLAKFRKNVRGEVDFGMNIRFAAEGTLSVGDEVVPDA
ncbi:MAG: MOSC N-terminal beta barrel domain-containing protein [Gemmatimonadota bacterium]